VPVTATDTRVAGGRCTYMDAVLADSFRRGSLRLGVRVTPYPDNRSCVDAVPAFLPEGSDCDFVWLPNVLDSGALGEQRAGRVNRVSRAAYNLTEFRRSLGRPERCGS
jgi:hypothetical protein